MNIGPGELIIRPYSATISHNTEWFGKMDPYIQFQFEGQSKKTQVCDKGGTKPTWSDVIVFNRVNGYLLNIKLWDYEKFKSHDFIASNEINILTTLQEGRTQSEIELIYEGESGARLKIGFEFKPQQLHANREVCLTSMMDSRKNKSDILYNQPTMVNQGFPVPKQYQNPQTYQGYQGNQPSQNPFANPAPVYSYQKQISTPVQQSAHNDPFENPYIENSYKAPQSMMRQNPSISKAVQQQPMKTSNTIQSQPQQKQQCQPSQKLFSAEDMDKLLSDD